jgi:hypothetical protein
MMAGPPAGGRGPRAWQATGSGITGIRGPCQWWCNGPYVTRRPRRQTLTGRLTIETVETATGPSEPPWAARHLRCAQGPEGPLQHQGKSRDAQKSQCHGQILGSRSRVPRTREIRQRAGNNVVSIEAAAAHGAALLGGDFQGQVAPNFVSVVMQVAAVQVELVLVLLPRRARTNGTTALNVHSIVPTDQIIRRLRRAACDVQESGDEGSWACSRRQCRRTGFLPISADSVATVRLQHAGPRWATLGWQPHNR